LKFTGVTYPTDVPAQYGIMLFDKEEFKNAPVSASATDFTFGDEQVTWLDQNGVSLVVNRFNGTIFRGE
jgi:hypothetical protein